MYVCHRWLLKLFCCILICTDLKNVTSPLKFDMVGKNILALFLQGTFFFTLNLLIEYNFFIKPRYGGKKVQK